MQKTCKKGRFWGKYYKFVSKDNIAFAVITYIANGIDGLQIITHNKSYQISDPFAIKFNEDRVNFNVDQEDIKISGELKLNNLVKPKRDVMGIYRYLPIECKHTIYAFIGDIDGILLMDNKEVSFNNGNCYIEGDAGKSFPKKYLWINGLDNNSSFTVSVATIPLGLIKILGHFAYLYINNKEYIFATYNFSKIKKLSKEYILFKRFRYRLKVSFDLSKLSSYNLKAPNKGEMSRYIREAVSTPTKVSLYKGKTLLYEKSYPNSSLENVGII